MLPAAGARPRLLASGLVGVLVGSILATGLTSGVSVGLSGPAGKHHVSAGNRCHRSKIDVPSCGVLWGLFKPRVPVPGQSHYSAHYPAVEHAIGRHLDLVKNYVDWRQGDTFPNSVDKSVAHHHRTLYFSWNPVDFTTHRDVTFASIARGDWDRSVIRPEARHLKHFHHRVFIDFGHEFDAAADEANGSAVEFRAAFRHIENVMHHVGVHNVVWTWVSTGYLGNKMAIKAGFPGSKYVDWIGYDPYNFAYCTGHDWRQPYRTFHPFYRWTRHQRGMRHKPLLLSEYGSAPGSHVEHWYASIPKTLRRLPRLRALIQFSGPAATPCAVQLSASRAAMAGFATAARAPRVLGR